MLSVVVPAHNVDRYLVECLASLARQNYREIEVLVLDDGSTDSTLKIARRAARWDRRFRVHSWPNIGLGASRNRGEGLARGEFLAFLDGDDVVDRHVYVDAIASLRASGSDFAVFPYRRLTEDDAPPAAPWVLEAHAVPRTGVRLTDRPDILVNAVAWSKVYRREFWSASEISFPTDVRYEDQVPSTRAFIHARSFDILDRVSVNWRIRSDRSSISQAIATPANIRDQRAAALESLALLRSETPSDVYHARIAQLLSNNLGDFFTAVPDMTPRAWQEFRLLAGDLLALAIQEDCLWMVDARAKILSWSARDGARDAVENAMMRSGWSGAFREGRTTASGLITVIETELASSGLDTPGPMGLLSPRETRTIIAIDRDAETHERGRVEPNLVPVRIGIGGLVDEAESLSVELCALPNAHTHLAQPVELQLLELPYSRTAVRTATMSRAMLDSESPVEVRISVGGLRRAHLLSTTALLSGVYGTGLADLA
ncbi:glycosyltransferase family 2 protein [Agromyces sp. Marseille-Q5079]|uniref:glycosyltransferase family 2 protein n=1 Tax=Agromyces sp. Marseille-Q5079 TaxID=3439059 RepID=UPI003D9CBE38